MLCKIVHDASLHFLTSPCRQLFSIRAVSTALKNEVMVWGSMHWKTLHQILSKICGLLDEHWYSWGQRIKGCALGTEHPKETLSILNDKAKLEGFALCIENLKERWCKIQPRTAVHQSQIHLIRWFVHFSDTQLAVYYFKLRICII